jgi:putative transposase
VIQIEAIHMDEDLMLVAAMGVDASGDKHPLGLTKVRRRTLRSSRRSWTILSSAGSIQWCRGFHHRRREGAVQGDPPNRRTRCGEVHMARNIMERLPKSLHASVRRVLRKIPLRHRPSND